MIKDIVNGWEIGYFLRMNWTISRILYILMRALNLTCRYRYVGGENIEEARKKGHSRSYLLGFWHQNLFAGLFPQVGLKFIIIVSKNKDAEPIVYICRKMKAIVVRGSSKKKGVDKGGQTAKNEMIEILKTGIVGLITVDGPTGPAGEVKPGIIDMAKKSGAPLIPYAPIAERYWSFNSWDQFRLPKPFSRVVIYYGTPLYVPRDISGNDFDGLKEKYKEAIHEGELKSLEAFKNWSHLSRKNTCAHSLHL